VAALGDDLPRLCADCQRRAATNPLRIFDCKVPEDQAIIDRLPHTIDYLCDECRAHFEAVQRYLGLYGIPYRISHRLVRGIDYYTRTTFEILVPHLGAQNAILGGGRYDGLVRQLGGPDRVGIGFAAGIERLVLALPSSGEPAVRPPDVFVAALGDRARDAAFELLRDLRRAGVNAQADYEGRSIRSQMKRADRLGAPIALIIGDDELARGEVTVRDMKSGEQHAISRAEAVGRFRPRAREGEAS
jgi:histidyl-tRNA synthetase